MNVVTESERNGSAELYRLLGDLGAEMTFLPTERTIGSWTTTEVLHAVCRAKDALIDVLRSALLLSQLGELDDYSKGWIAEALLCSDKDQSLLEHVEDDLAHQCPRLPL